MDNVIDVSIPVAQVIDQHPEVLDLLVELGFKPLASSVLTIFSIGVPSNFDPCFKETLRPTVLRMIGLAKGLKPNSTNKSNTSGC